MYKTFEVYRIYFLALADHLLINKPNEGGVT